MATFLLVLHVFTCILLVLVVLVQSGKDGGIGMMAGGGSSQTVFGSSGGANFFTKFTSGCAAVFMITSIFLTITKGNKHNSVFAGQAPAAKSAPGTLPPSTPGASGAPAATPGSPTATAPAATNEAPAAPAAKAPEKDTTSAAPTKK
ncbi:MAG: preprotein translocase subunit SecG [Deltaproteobacteria bacterium]|nr:preprotein translocase subunit SecG [Deltaproteobacteria bacterium]